MVPARVRMTVVARDERLEVTAQELAALDRLEQTLPSL